MSPMLSLPQPKSLFHGRAEAVTNASTTARCWSRVRTWGTVSAQYFWKNSAIAPRHVRGRHAGALVDARAAGPAGWR